MDTLHSSTTTTIGRPVDKRLRIPWGKKAIPLKNSTLFNKAKHSEEWHQSIDATAGVLHPSDSKFPYSFLRDHTEDYLKKKGKINQADVDIRLSILFTSHDAKDVAVAASAHAITAKSLRALLHADLNVMHGSCWGLKMWLQCLIAANDGNPASVTDLEALWARKLLPFATQGPRAAEWYLVGVCRILREMAIQNMDVIPEFSILMRRAITEYATRLEGMRLRNDWAAGYEAVLWLIELAKTSPSMTPPGHLLPEHILDLQFPAWRIWTHWKPDVICIKRLAASDDDMIAMLSDLIALEGPDMITGMANTLRDGLVARYNGAQTMLRWRGIVIEVSNRTKESLKAILERVTRLLEMVITASAPNRVERFELFRSLVITRPITTKNLDIFEATCKIPHIPKSDIYKAVREVVDSQQRLGGQHILALQNLICALDDDLAADLRKIVLQDWLHQGIENCVRECQEVVRDHIDKGLPWTNLVIEYHTFCTTVKASERHWPKEYQTMKIHPQWPSSDDVRIVAEIYEAAQAQQLKPIQIQKALSDETHNVTTPSDRVSIHTNLDGDAKRMQLSLQDHVEAYCKDYILGQETMSQRAQNVVDSMMHVWKNTSKPHTDTDRRNLAIILTKSAGTYSSLCCRCLANIAFTSLSITSVTHLSGILRKSKTNLNEAIVDLTNLLAKDASWAQCWTDLLHLWLSRQCQSGTFKGDDVLEHSLQTMDIGQWIRFMYRIERLFVCRQDSSTAIPSILDPALLAWKSILVVYTDVLVHLEAVLGQGSEPLRCFVTCRAWADQLIAILLFLARAEEKPVEVLMEKVVGKMSEKKDTIMNIKDCLQDLAIATPEALEICWRVWETKHDGLEILGLPETAKNEEASKDVVVRKAVPKSAVCSATDQGKIRAPPTIATKSATRRAVPVAVVEIMVAGWIQSDSISKSDKNAVASVAGVLELCERSSAETWNSKLNEATRFWEGIENEILAEAARLESLTKGLRAKDPKGTALLLQELGIPGNSLLDDEMENLPPGLVDTVERVGEDEVEISFPLGHFTDLQRQAMGIPVMANSFLLRLNIPASDTQSPGFCTHYDNDTDLDTLDHITWPCSPNTKVPRDTICKTPQTAFAWQLQHIIHAYLGIENMSIADLHKRVRSKMSSLGQTCVSCDTLIHASPTAQIRRSVPCQILDCTRLWYALPLDVRIPEIRIDIYVVDLMLTSVHAAAMSGRPELLPACPIRNMETIKAILKSLPSLRIISHAANISAVLSSYHKDAEVLISWACVHHRGYIASAQGLCKVPNMPVGTHQFVLANAGPRLESDFLNKFPTRNAKTSVLFHGTTFDRLPAILAQGLKVCSGTSLQRTGAAHGKGIYMAEEPVTSLTYSAQATSWRNSGLANMRLLLGCEVVVGAGRSVSSGIHLVTDEMGVMVRYIFLLTGGVSAPIANHVVPAMASGMNALRTGAV
jgi:hypothetical protein